MKNAKRLKAWILSIVLLFGAVPVFRSEPAVLTAGAEEVSDIPYWEQFEMGEYDIFTYRRFDDHIEIAQCDRSVEVVEIPAEIDGLPVTSIGFNAFGQTEWFDLPLIENEDGTYEDNTPHLKAVTIPDTVTSIGRSAFGSCPLTEIVIPDSVTKIEEMAFGYCSELESVTLPEGEMELAAGIFKGTPWLENYFKTHEFFIHAGLLVEGNPVLWGDVSVPEGVTTINKSAFAGNKGIVNITLPESLTTIGEDAFYHCEALEKVTVLGNIESLGESVFDSCIELKTVSFEGTLCDIPVGVFRQCFALKTITIPEGVTSIGRMAFWNCPGLTELHLPDTLKEIEEEAFGGCESLLAVEIPAQTTVIGTRAFYECAALAELTLHEGLQTIGDSAFARCEELESVVIPGTVTRIGSYAFSRCTSLADVTLPEGFTNIGTGAFNGTPWQDLQYDENGYYIVDSVLVKADPALEGEIVIPEGVTAIGKGAFLRNININSVVIPEGVTYIDDSAFYGCMSMKSVSLPGTLTGVGAEAFAGCSTLPSIVIPEGVEHIGAHAFERCNRLTELRLPDSVTSVGEYAFANNVSLTRIRLSESLTDIGDHAFESSTKLTEIRLPQSLENLGEWVFYNCSGLTSITIPDGMTEISGYVFKGCSSLAVVRIPQSVTKIGTDAFGMCKGLSDVYYGGTEETWNAIMFLYTSKYDLETAELHFNSTGVTLYGDADCSGSVDLVDVVAVNRNIMIGSPLTVQGELNADVDGNGIVDDVDSLNILKSIIHLVELPLSQAPASASEEKEPVQELNMDVRSLEEFEAMKNSLSLSDEELESYLKGLSGYPELTREDLQDFVELVSALPVAAPENAEVTWINHDVGENADGKPYDIAYITFTFAEDEWVRFEYLLSEKDVKAAMDSVVASPDFTGTVFDEPIENADGSARVYAVQRDQHVSGNGDMIRWYLDCGGMFVRVYHRTKGGSTVAIEALIDDLKPLGSLMSE